MFMNYQTTVTVSPANGSTGTWSLDGQLIPNPLSFGAYNMTDSVGSRSGEFVNSQIPGATHGDRLGAFLNDFTRWRLAYASVTIYQDGPDLANQGTVVVCQKPVVPFTYTVDEWAWQAAAPFLGAMGARPAFTLDASDMPNYSASQAMPNAYFGKSKEGAYIPLKLTHSHQAWHSQADLIYQCANGGHSGYTSNNTGGRVTIPNGGANANVSAYPFLSANDLHWFNNGGPMVMYGSLTSAFCNENWADFSFRNLSVSTSLSMFFRFGFECQVQPTSMLSPHLKLSPEYDAQAVDTYFKICRELKDAYPADYNDLGKIWDVISGIAKTVAPALSAIPVVGPALSVGVPAAAAIGDRIRGAMTRASEPSRGSTASSADIELVRELEAAPPQVPARPRLKKKKVSALSTNALRRRIAARAK